METQTAQTARNEKLLYREFRKKINSEAARAQVKKLEYDLADEKAGLNYLKTACADANSLGLGGVCVLPCFAKQCSAYLGTERKTSLIAVISSPRGGDATEIKVKAVKRAIKDGADEAEVAAPIAHVRDGNFAYVKREFKKLRSAAKRKSLRVGLECAYLTREEITRACTLAADCGVNSVSLSGGNCAEWLSDVKSAVKDRCTVKAEGVATVLEMSSSIDLGATVIGSKNAADVARAILTAAENDY